MSLAHGKCCSQDHERVGLQRLPYDVLLHIASFVDVDGLTSLGMTCHPLHNFCSTRPVYRRFANDLLRRCRALPLKGFQRVSDLTTSQLIRSVQKAAHYESAWRVRGPRPVGGGRATSPTAAARNLRGERAWYTVVSTPPGEEIDWLSPITSSYTLCATKSGKVVCWDVRSDTCLAEWIPEEKWELWKCRVEFEQQTVYFTMARLLSGTHEDDRVMEFILMRLDFSEAPSGDPTVPPTFRHVSTFRTMGVVMNVFLLDPPARLLAAFIYIARTNNVGLYVILDWDKGEYVFVDTGIECDMSSNWSCALFERNVVIHSEDSETAHQHFYPVSLLQTRSRRMSAAPHVVGDLKPALTISKKFTFPASECLADPPAPVDAAASVASPLPSSSSFPSTSPLLSNASLSPLAMTHHLPLTSATSTFALIDTGAQPMSTPFLANINLPSQAEPPSPHSLLDLDFDLASSNSVNYDATTEAEEAEEPPATDPAQPNDVADEPPSSEGAHAMEEARQPATAAARQRRAHNPFPFPHWYPESVHFVRQWWPSVVGIPRVSCTVCLLVSQDAYGCARFVLAQHYFRVPMSPVRLAGPAADEGDQAESGFERAHDPGTAPRTDVPDWRPREGEVDARATKDGQRAEGEDAPMQMWYVSSPFDVVCIAEGDEETQLPGSERQRPLVAVDFGHAVWLEYVEPERAPDVREEDARENLAVADDVGTEPVPDADLDDGGQYEDLGDADARPGPEAKRLRFVTFPIFDDVYEAGEDARPAEGQVRTLEVPKELDLNDVETINIDQSQGAIVLSVREGKIFILCYE